MQVRIKRPSDRLLVVLLTVGIAVSVTLLRVVPHFRTVAPTLALKGSDTLKDEISLPNGWKKLEVKNQVIMRLPQDLKPIEPRGNSFAYREAYSNRDIKITIVYGEVIPPRPNQRDPFASCDTPRSLLEEPTYNESVIEINGRKAKLGIDRTHPPDSIIAHVCFPVADDNAMPLRVVAYCKDDRALETAQQIFTSIRFKEDR